MPEALPPRTFRQPSPPKRRVRYELWLPGIFGLWIVLIGLSFPAPSLAVALAALIALGATYLFFDSAMATVFPRR